MFRFPIGDIHIITITILDIPTITTLQQTHLENLAI